MSLYNKLKRYFHPLRAVLVAILIFLLGLGVSFAQKVPLPEEILGFKVGADYHLATYEQPLEYFRALEKASPRMKVFEMGKTEMGKPMIYVVITSEDNMSKLDRYKEISGKLALAKDLTDEEARRLAAEPTNPNLHPLFFSRELFSMLLHEGLINLELGQKILRWRYTGFNVHTKERTTTKREAERVGKYMIGPLLSLKRLSIDKAEGKVCYQYGKDSSELERMDYLEFIARVTSHIPDKGQVMIRYYGLYANAHRGKMSKAGVSPSHPPIIEEEERFVPSKGWVEMIRKVYEVDPLLCPACGGQMSIISFIEDHKVIDKIIRHLKLTFYAERPPPPHVVQQELLTAAEEREEYF